MIYKILPIYVNFTLRLTVQMILPIPYIHLRLPKISALLQLTFIKY